MSFNPCFPGTRSSTPSKTVAIPFVHSFNPCFPGTRSSTPYSYIVWNDLVEFQSLFSWNSLFDIIFTFFPRAHTISFNPCFPGTRSSTLKGISRSSPAGVSILVFLELALRLRLSFLHVISSICFNPCFPGTRSSTFRLLSSLESSVCFNPCFPGTRSSTIDLLLHYISSVMFQSLFSWNSLFDSGDFSFFLADLPLEISFSRGSLA